MSVRKTYAPEIIDGAEIHRIVKDGEMFSKGSLFARVCLAKDEGVDWHTHIGEAEYYYILKGQGVFTDTDGSEHTVEAGDVCTIKPGQSHAIRNEHAETLEFIALILYG